MTNLSPLVIRKRLGREYWGPPMPFGDAGWRLDHRVLKGRIIITESELTKIGAPAGQEWIHASISWDDDLPTYSDLTMLHKAVWPDGYAYQVFAPPSQHVNIAKHALHLWGLADGSPILPEFGKFGTI